MREATRKARVQRTGLKGSGGLLLLTVGLLTAGSPAWASAATTTRVSMSSEGRQGNGDSFAPAISTDGRVVAFTSEASDLVGGDTNGTQSGTGADVFVRILATGVTERVSVSSSGQQAALGSRELGPRALSANGRYITYASDAWNLVPGDTNRATDVFVHDRRTGATSRVSVSSAGEQGDADSSLAGGAPSISGDGRYVAFVSSASNLAAGAARGGIFVHDRVTGSTVRADVSSNGQGANGLVAFPVISLDGRRVAFLASASNLVAGDTNQVQDVFVRDLVARTTTRVSVNSAGHQANGYSTGASLSAAGRFVAFASAATNLVSGDKNGTSDIFIHDLQTGATVLASAPRAGTGANGLSSAPQLSANGRYLAFTSRASNLTGGDVNGHADVFVRDLSARTTRLLSVSSLGVQGNNDSGRSSLSGDGSNIAFESVANNLVPADTNRSDDIFVSS